MRPPPPSARCCGLLWKVALPSAAAMSAQMRPQVGEVGADVDGRMAGFMPGIVESIAIISARGCGLPAITVC